MLYGLKGRIISCVAGAGAISSTLLFALEQSNILKLIPVKYAWVQALVTAVLVMITVLSERAQGGASSPQVRAAAEASDRKNEVR